MRLFSLKHANSATPLAQILVLWSVYLLLTVFCKAVQQGDQLHYLGVAWEMWERGEYAIPLASGAWHLEKPPLLFWMLQVSWRLFGSKIATAQCLEMTIALLVLGLLYHIALHRQETILRAHYPILLLASLPAWVTFASDIRFENLLTLALLAQLRLISQAGTPSVLPLALSFAFGLFVKGPVFLLYSWPLALWPLCQLGLDKWLWYKRYSLALLLGAIIAGSWLLLIAYRLGWSALHYALVTQIRQRTGLTMNYRAFKPIMHIGLSCLPWILWPACYCGWRSSRREPLELLLILLILNLVVCFSVLVVAKHSSYWIPVYPLLALLMACHLQKQATQSLPTWYLWPGNIAMLGFAIVLYSVQLPVLHATSWAGGLVILGFGGFCWQTRQQVQQFGWMCLLGICLSIMRLAGYAAYQQQHYDLRPITEALHSRTAPMIRLGYHGDDQNYAFLAKLPQGIPRIEKDALAGWLRAHPNGYVLLYSHQPLSIKKLAMAQLNKQYVVTLAAASELYPEVLANFSSTLR